MFNQYLFNHFLTDGHLGFSVCFVCSVINKVLVNIGAHILLVHIFPIILLEYIPRIGIAGLRDIDDFKSSIVFEKE